MKFYVYLHCKPDLTPFYVGKGCGDRSYRFNNRNQHHKNIVEKYGKKNIVVLEFKKDSEKSAFESEKRMIQMLHKAGFELSNKSEGGEGGASGIKRSLETLAKKATSMKAVFSNPEYLKKLSISGLGNKNALGNKGRLGQTPWNKGKTTALETRSKLSKAAMGNNNRNKNAEMR